MRLYTNLTKLKHKILLVLTLFVSISIIIGLSAYFFINYLNHYNDLLLKAERIYTLGSEAESATLAFQVEDITNEDFMQNGISINTSKFYNSITEIETLLADPSLTSLLTSQEEAVLLNKLTLTGTACKSYFTAYTQKIRERGFKDHGLEGRMRQAVHSLQEQSKHLDLATVLMMRRHEKDFIIRHDLSYADKLLNVAEQLQDQVALHPALSEKEKQQVKGVINAYVDDFMRIVAIEREIGLERTTGIKASLYTSLKQFDTTLSDVKLRIQAHYQQAMLTSLLIFGSAFLVLVSGSIVLSFMLADVISKPIALINKAAQAASKGQQDVDRYLDKVSNKDEVGLLANSFRSMYKHLSSIITETQEKSLALETLVQENQKRSWRNEGLSQLSEILRTHPDDLTKLADSALAFVVKYIGANQGCIFLAQETTEGKRLELSACFAYNKKKWLEKTIQPGQGLAGQCYLEKSTTLLTEIPAGYINITSGLGEATPRSLLLVPLLANEQAVGVFEIASFNTPLPHEIQFMEQAAEAIAGIVINTQVNLKTQALLEASNRYASELASQEENLRQNLEELSAIQEASAREQAIQNTRYENLHTIIQQNKSIIIALDAQYAVMEFNKAAAHKMSTIGIQLQHGLNFMEAMPQSSQEKCKTYYDKALAGEEVIILESFKEGNQLRTFEIQHYPLYSNDHSVIGICIVSTDITEWTQQTMEYLFETT